MSTSTFNIEFVVDFFTDKFYEKSLSNRLNEW